MFKMLDGTYDPERDAADAEIMVKMAKAGKGEFSLPGVLGGGVGRAYRNSNAGSETPRSAFFASGAGSSEHNSRGSESNYGTSVRDASSAKEPHSFVGCGSGEARSARDGLALGDSTLSEEGGERYGKGGEGGGRGHARGEEEEEEGAPPSLVRATLVSSLALAMLAQTRTEPQLNHFTLRIPAKIAPESHSPIHRSSTAGGGSAALYQQASGSDGAIEHGTVPLRGGGGDDDAHRSGLER